MIRKIQRDTLMAELQSLRALLIGAEGAAPLTALSLKARLAGVEEELSALEREMRLTGEVAIFFTGKRVQGSRGIDAEFATNSLRHYQDLVSKTVLHRLRGPLAQRGPLKEREVARLNITGTAPGSFGFVLEEDGADQSPLFPTAVKEAMEQVTELLKAFSSPEEAAFASAFDDLDPRTLKSLKDLLEDLNESEATMRLVEGDREVSLDRQSVERAAERASQSRVDEREVEIEGRLIGIGPTRRTFEFRREDTGDVLTGRVDSQLSGAFLRRVTESPVEIGERRVARMLVRETERRGASPRITYTLLNLSDESAADEDIADFDDDQADGA
ncbi:hypothetical protein KPL78_00960 [Roseomonas sp. HJA6]|uniref:Uncharacterized protein n=1 Tax=Roseomonas alba TaxID=2846776 RepID=A0ABS7A2T0_9PROT|nr:hypothetical protein [Neoroseomonas alba]MBW6396390.1 hypothetical protein [Neoroseomonas alba]